jgi:hypothetical protein
MKEDDRLSLLMKELDELDSTLDHNRKNVIPSVAAGPIGREGTDLISADIEMYRKKIKEIKTCVESFNMKKNLVLLFST